jgi:hypothetical protein
LTLGGQGSSIVFHRADWIASTTWLIFTIAAASSIDLFMPPGIRSLADWFVTESNGQRVILWMEQRQTKRQASTKDSFLLMTARWCRGWYEVPRIRIRFKQLRLFAFA